MADAGPEHDWVAKARGQPGRDGSFPFENFERYYRDVRSALDEPAEGPKAVE